MASKYKRLKKKAQQSITVLFVKKEARCYKKEFWIIIKNLYLTLISNPKG